MQKRSRRVTPAIIGSMISLTLLTGCGEEEVDANVFETVEQCAASGEYTPQECQQYFQEAQAAQAEAAPKYENRADCEAEFGPGRCNDGPEMAVEGHSTMVHSYVPLAAGIMIGAAISQPLYRTFHNNSYGSFTTANGMTVSNAPGRTRIVRSVAASRPTRTTTTMRRGGFGAM
ncbi:MAG TPA: DUF1190 domain-containing protein, partial [Candidatus Obscuribacterales bacterium]